MQKGFDKGYCEGFVTGKAIGKLRGLVSSRIVLYRQILKNEEAAKELDALFDEVDKTEVHHIYSVDYFRDEKGENYISPESFIKDLEDKVNTTLDIVAKKYSSWTMALELGKEGERKKLEQKQVERAMDGACEG